MTHTIESLCALIGPDGKPVSDEAGEKLRIWTAEADGWRKLQFCNYNGTRILIGDYPDADEADRNFPGGHDGWLIIAPLYTTSLDAIFAAEERVGLHTQFYGAAEEWEKAADEVIYRFHDCVHPRLFAFLTPAQRCIPLILTKQWIENQKP